LRAISADEGSVASIGECLRVVQVEHHRAAREAGLDRRNLFRLLKRRDDLSSADSRHAAADNRILELSQDISETTGQEILDRVERGEMRDGDLVKAYIASTKQVATKQRWSQGSRANDAGAGISALAKILQGKRVTIEDTDPAEEAVDVTEHPESACSSNF